MKLKTKIYTFLLIFVYSYSFGQIEQYNYKREIKGITDQWHKIILPNEVLSKTSYNLSGIRIYGITKKNDTIEAPFLLRLVTDKLLNKEVSFNILNSSHNEKGYYFTFEVLSNETINQINLDFKQKNFDWRIKLEGSQNQQEWYTVLDDYRLLSIKNDLTDFQFTHLSFPNSNYRFFRLLIESQEKPELIVAKISKRILTDGIYNNYPIKKINSIEQNKNKQTEIDINLQSTVPVCYLKIDIKDTFDYYRPITIKYLADSVKTEKGWNYSYNTLMESTLNSFETNVFKFKSTFLQKLKIIIYNRDNQPLAINSFKVLGFVHELVIRFTEPASYILAYGNNKAEKPQYDINQFAEKIPETLTTLELGPEHTIVKKNISGTEPLFKNKTWLWVIMVLIILLLGWFSINMIRNK